MLNSVIDFNTDELDNDYPVYYNLFSGCESDTPPTPEQCGVGLSDEEYYKKLEKVRLMEMEDNNRMRRWELQTYGKTDREYAYGKDWKYIPPSQAIVVDRNNIALYWKPSNMNAGNKTPFIADAITDVKSPNAQGAVIFDSRSIPSSSMVISDGDHFTKMTTQERRIVNTVERLSKNNDTISLQSFINMEEASFNQRMLNHDTSLDSSLNKYINQGGNRMSIPPVTEMKFNPEDIKRINDMGNGNNGSFFNGLTNEEVAAKWNYMSNNNIPINAAKDVIFGDVKTPVSTATTGTAANQALNAAISASFNGGSMGNTNNVYIPTSADMEAAKKKYNELTGGNTVPPVNATTAQPATATKPQDDPVAQMVQRGVNNMQQATATVQQQPNDLLGAIMAKMSAMVQNNAQVSAPAPEIHHTVFTAGGTDTKGTLREQLLTMSNVLMYGINLNNQDLTTAINIILDLAGLEQKDLYTKQNQGIDYNIFCKVIDQLCDRISKVTDGTGFFINQQIIKYVQNTIVNGPNSLIEPLYFYEMLATLAFEGYISLADNMYPDLRNSLLQAILYFQKNPMPDIPKDPNHPDGKLNMVPILFGPGGLFETQMVYLNNNSTTYTTAPVATQTVYNVNQTNLGGNSMNSVFDRYDSRQMATTVTGVNPYGTLYSTTAGPVGGYNYVGNGSTVTSTGTYGTAMAPNNIYMNGTASAFQAGIQTALGGYGAGRDSVMATPINNNFIRTGVATQPVVNTYQQPVISARYAPVANTTVYGGTQAPAQSNNQVDMMGMFATMLGMLSSIENVGGRNVIDVRNLASMLGGGTGGAGVVERFGRATTQPMNTFGTTYGTTFGSGMWGNTNWGTTNYGNTWNATRPAGWGTTGTIPTFTSTTGTWGSATPTYNSGLGLSFATPTTTGLNLNTTSTFNYNPAASVGSGVSNLTFGGTTGNWGTSTTPTWGGNTGTWGGNTAGFVNNTVQNTGHTVFGRQGEDKIAAALGLTR